MKTFARTLVPVVDILLSPLTLIAAVALRFVRRAGIFRLPRCRAALRSVGIFPIRNHYYEPLFNPIHLGSSLRKDRELPGIDWNIAEQISLMQKFHYNEELLGFPLEKAGELQYFYNNDAFASGDAEFLYNMIRTFHPKRFVEIGSGYSTLLARSALLKNSKTTGLSTCEHICIEPYEMPWLEKTGAKIIRKKVEDVERGLFSSLERNDILFIDSSHMIRPQGDVVVEFLELLPILQSGVLVHIHDIFSPKDYLDEWIKNDVRFWNEQYLLEAFLTFNREFEIVGAVNYLRHHHCELLVSKCPILKAQLAFREPGSFWIRKR